MSDADGGGPGGPGTGSGGAASRARSGTAAAEQDAVIAALTPVIDGIAATLGSFCEVVIHDFRRPEHSIVALAGSVTGRGLGGSMSEIGMHLLARGDQARDELNYLTRTRDGKMVKSSTMVLRDSSGTVFGALCVNLDITTLNQVHALVGEIAGVAASPAAVPTTTFGDDIGAVLDAIVDEHQLRQNKPWAQLGRGERLQLFRDLDRRGVFAVRGAVQQVAARLGVSRASAYNYLSAARTEAGDDTGLPDGTP
ncbi:PAS domain-containing protein [Streptomyces sp. NPDC046931]|uniref:helix-turn-helix transcriptional regulator n=1 Tax=Streptomyces sp. NPDC046931 TaxID=3154806 RepID=UPI0033EC9904